MNWKEAEGKARDLSGAKDWQDPNPTTTMRLANMTLKKIALLTSAMDMPFGRNTSTLTNLSATGVVIYPLGGGSYVAATKTFSGMTLDQTYCGGIVFFTNGTNGYYGLIDSVSTNSCVLRLAAGTAAMTDIVSANLFAMFKPNPFFYAGANLSALNRFRNIKIVDGTNGNITRLSSHEFAGMENIYKYDLSVTSEDAGDALYLNKGGSVTSYGTLTLSYDEMPDLITSGSTVLDLRPENLEMFVYEVARLLRNTIQQPIVDEKMISPMKPLEDKVKQYVKNLSPKDEIRK